MGRYRGTQLVMLGTVTWRNLNTSQTVFYANATYQVALGSFTSRAYGMVYPTEHILVLNGTLPGDMATYECDVIDQDGNSANSTTDLEVYCEYCMSQY